MTARAEVLTAACMRREGYSYDPVDPDEIVDTATDTDFASAEYAATKGFGVTTEPVFKPGGSNPNLERADSLPPAERQRYTGALARCSEQGQREANKEFGVAAANRRFDRTDAKVRRDPEFVRAEQQWQHCARARGFTARDRLELIDQLRERAGVIQGRLLAQVNGRVEVDSFDRLRAADPEFQALRRDELLAATETFPCSQSLDAAYVRVYRRLRGS